MPTTIGSLTNVPVPGDPVQSAWAQDVSRLPIHRFTTLAALKAGWTAPPDGAFAYVTGEEALLVAKAGTWRWWTKDFGPVTGAAAWLTYTAAAQAGSCQTALSIAGRTATIRGLVALTTAAQAGNVAVANLPAAYRSAVALNLPAAGYGSNYSWGVRLIVQTTGDLQFFWGGAATALNNLLYNISWTLPDLVAA